MNSSDFEVVSKEYAVEVDIEKFIRLERREDKCKGLSLGEELDKLDGVDRTEYNGHFGSAIWFRIDTANDCDKLRNKIAKIIQKHLDKK